jgi:Flp pilus assembly protein TadD
MGGTAMTQKGDSPLFPRIAKKGTVPFNTVVRTALALGAIALAVWMVSEPTFDYGFAYDDHAVVLERPPAWEQGWREFAATRGWGVARHVALLSLDLDRREPLAPRPFRITNSALAAVNAALLFCLAGALGLSAGASLATALLFAVHPAHVDAVVSIVGRAELLAAAGVLCALTLHARAYFARTSVAVLAGLAFFVALSSKESAASLLALLVVYEVFRPGANSGEKRARRPRAWAVPYAVAVAAWLALAVGKFATVDPIVFADNPLAHVSASARVLGAGEILWKYVGHAVWPFGLKPDLGYAEVTTSTAGGIAAWLTWAAVALAAWALRARGSKPAVVGFAALWLPAAFAVTGNVLMPIGTMMADRLLYLPSAGVCLLAGAAIDLVARATPLRRWAGRAALGVVLLALALSYTQRARIWTDDAHYHEQAAALSPRSAKAHFNLGLSLARRDRYEEAERSFGRALHIVPDFTVAAQYRAEALRRLGRLPDAAAVYAAYLEVAPDDVAILRVAAAFDESLGNHESALARLRRAVDLAPDDTELRVALAETEARARAAAINP